MNVILLRGCAAIRQGQDSFEASERISDDRETVNYYYFSVSNFRTKKIYFLSDSL